MWQRQPDLVLAQANPASGVPYPVLVATEDVRIISIAARVDFTVQPSPLEARMTVDGVVDVYDLINPATATWYCAGSNSPYTGGSLVGADVAQYRAFLMEGQNIAVECETTGGTVQFLYARVKWARLLPT
jgi:hypothetical protein